MMNNELNVELYMKEVARIPVLTRQQEVELFKRLEAGDERAREEIVRANLRFVVKIANTFLGQGMSLSDLIQEGNLGLLEVIGKFKYKKGYRFSTYSAFWIRQAIQTALFKQRGIARLPVRKSRMLGYINEEVRQFSQINGREPTHAEIAQRLDIAEEQVDLLMQYRKFYCSLDEEQNDSRLTLLDTLAGPESGSPRAICEIKQRRKSVRQLLERLTERERKILRLRFGFHNGTEYSLRRTSKVLGLSQEGVRRIERKALAKLKRPAMQQALAA